MIYKRTSGKYFLSISAFTLVFAALLFINRAGYLRDESAENAHNTRKLNDEVNVITNTYHIMTDIIFEEIVNRPEVIYYLADSSRNPANKEKNRALLEKKLRGLYSLLLEHNYRQLHFHLPDSESFLRMHRPGKYGDILKGFRDTIKYVMENRRPSSGFEEGRIFNGYRFVYPLFYEGLYAGSVEISLSMGAINRIMEEMFARQYGFMIRKDVVESKVFESELENYESCGISDDYLIDKEVESRTICDRFEQLKADNTGKYKKIRALVDSGKSFCINLPGKYGGSFIFISVENFSGRHVGYVLTEEDGAVYRQLRRDYMTDTAMLITIYLLLASGFVFVIYSREKFRHIAIHDKVTGAFSRHMFYEVFEKMVHKIRRNESTMAVIMADVDDFKSINDRHGHFTGDKVLKHLTEVFVRNIRHSDYVARWGGEEFMILLNDINMENGKKVAEKLRGAVETEDFPKVGRVTCSFGICEVNCENANVEEILNDVDGLLYRAKHNGKNRVEY